MNIKVFVMMIITMFNTNVLCKEKYYIRSQFYTKRFLGSSGSTGIDDIYGIDDINDIDGNYTRRFLGSSGSTGLDDSLM
jgi:hypothetical protein